MAEKIVNLGDVTGNGFMRNPEQALKDALDCVGKEGAFENGKKVLILALDDSDGSYEVNFMQAGMKMSECIALCEVAKTVFLEEMNYI